VIAIISFFGWILFVIFVGVGFSALPIDLFREWKGRPLQMAPSTFEAAKQTSLQRCKLLLQLGEQTKEAKVEADRNPGWGGRKYRKELKRKLRLLETGTLIMEQEFTTLEKVSDYKNKYSPLLYFSKLILGFLCSIVSILWIIHILVYMIIVVDGVPLHPFFNNLLTFLSDNSVAFLSTFIFALLSVYLLWATMKGNFKFGMRFTWITFYPMQEHETFMNAFLFNVLLINIWSFSLTQFDTYAFADYVRGTQINMIFGVQIKYMYFYQWFYRYNVFIYAILAWAVITLIYLLCKRVDRFDPAALLERETKHNQKVQMAVLKK